MSYGTCTICGCTDNNCSQCIEKTGEPCFWVDSGHEICSACYDDLVLSDQNESRIPIPLIMNFTKEELDFTETLMDKIKLFRDDVKHANPRFSGYETTTIRIRNIDLWIDANIGKHPLLQEFRTYVLEEMKVLNISKWPDYVYKEQNHFK